MSRMMESMLQRGEEVIRRAGGSAIGSNSLAGLDIWITTRRILVSTGWLQRKVEARMLRDISSVELLQTLLDRMTGIGTIRIVFRQPHLPSIDLIDVKNARELHAELLRLQGCE